MTKREAESIDAAQTVRVLLLEDSALDAELVVNQLITSGLQLDLRRVWTRESFLDALGHDPDVILADHVLPQFDGDAALELAQARAPHIPFMFVSGTLTEELAVQALRRGAIDYVVKQRLHRLPDAVRRAVAEAREHQALRQTEAALRKTEERLRLIADSLPVLIAYVDAEQRYRFANQAYEDWFGRNPSDIVGRHVREIAGEAAYQRVRPAIERVLAGQRQSFEATVAHRNDSVRQLQIDYVPEIRPDGSISGYYALGTDISERKAAEATLRRLNETLETQVHERTQALLQSEARLRAILETSFQYQGLLSLEGTVLDANATSLQGILSTRHELIGRPFWDTPWFGGTAGMPELARRIVARVAQGDTVREEMTLQLPTGERSFDFSMRPLHDHDGKRVALVFEAVDITARRQTEDALRQSQKMEAVGQLTGGIAHDFNNLLTVISGNIDITLSRLERADQADPRITRTLENALRGAERAAALTQRLLAFSRRQPLQPRPLDLGQLVLGMTDLLRRSLGETIELEVSDGPGLWPVEADPNQLEAAILNLAVNARDAMPEGGRLLIETSNVHLDDAYTAHDVEVLPGPYAIVCVTDNGCGMSPDTRARVFEPFFTTKDVGRGTGLGLSMVYGFIKQSGGHIELDSEPGRGTSVRLFLPRLDRDAHLPDDQPGRARPESSMREETVLVVEDDDDVRAYTVECLRGLGYRVLEAHDGDSALRLLERPETRVELLFTDVVMPGISGRELADRAQALQPGLRILFTSGYTRDAIPQGGFLDLGIAMIPKPFTYASLASRVRDILGHPGHASH
ncbi:PAS domain-containing protein [Frateuria terrea]|uniref:histidine kinase n=1 Tax=Frateuria terrea TaxID=529704 RepID=A0A1H6RDR2_9GAMM|nr:PAS domain-containing protein [Frateuria terrea]SEI51384.1 PAS domain S-box-containing protein [Frateuria terrea]SFP16277.1 PAS domain S-box-containing protein [Frateuria terrea]